MATSRVTKAFFPNVSYLGVTVVVGLTAVVALSEAFLFFGHVQETLWTYSVLLFALSVGPVVLEREATVFQAFALIPVFRLVNLAMPVFVELTVFWLPLVYGPFIPAIVYLGRWRPTDASVDAVVQSVPGSAGIGRGLPWWLGGARHTNVRPLLRACWRRLRIPEDASPDLAALYRISKGLFVLSIPVFVVGFLLSMGVTVVYLAELEYAVLTPTPLIPSLDPVPIGVLTVTMIGFVGFVEELLFRGVLQQVLERHVGLVPGLLLASGLFALMHSGYGIRMELLFAGGVGLLFGILYDATGSLGLVSVMHGSLNALVFGVIPLDGGSSVDLIQGLLIRELQGAGVWWLIESALDAWGYAAVAALA